MIFAIGVIILILTGHLDPEQSACVGLSLCALVEMAIEAGVVFAIKY